MSDPAPSTRAGHVLLKVADLHAAVADFRAAGFTVDYAADPAKAHNAHVWFARGPFLELFSLPSAAVLAWPVVAASAGTAMAGRIARWARTRTEGFVDLALEVDDPDLTQVRRRLDARGAGLGRIRPGRRVRPDGQEVRYQFAMAGRAHAPFLVSAYDPPQRPPSTAHPNGATAITTITLGVGPAERRAVDALLDPSDPHLVRENAPRTGVRSVALAGLTHRPDPATVRGAVLLPA